MKTSILKIDIYGRKGKHPSMVLRKVDELHPGNRVVYRIPRIVCISLVEEKLRQGVSVIPIHCRRNRNRVLEIGILDGIASIFVFELLTGRIKLKFKWKGPAEELQNVLKNIA